jgi:hypothetical protein
VIFRRILFLLAAATMIAVSAGVIVVALAFALYALVKPGLGQAGAAGVVAGAAAVLIALVGLLLALSARRPRRKAFEPKNLFDRAFQFLKEKPVTAVAAAAAAGLLMVRNPEYLGAAIRAFVEGRNPPRR